jgi:hypothetical protein
VTFKLIITYFVCNFSHFDGSKRSTFLLVSGCRFDTKTIVGHIAQPSNTLPSKLVTAILRHMLILVSLLFRISVLLAHKCHFYSNQKATALNSSAKTAKAQVLITFGLQFTSIFIFGESFVQEGATACDLLPSLTLYTNY